MDFKSKMIRDIKVRYGFSDEVVLSAMEKVPRHEFVEASEGEAYSDDPVSIGFGQTMSQPYTVAYMTHLLLGGEGSHFTEASGDKKVLEIGTGSGYQAAVLSELVGKVYTIEIIPELFEKAKKKLKDLRYKNVYVKRGSGEFGWEEYAPYDGIMITAGIESGVPKKLLDQLKVGGILVAPVGKGADKEMTVYRKKSKFKMKKSRHGTFHFVPFVREG